VIYTKNKPGAKFVQRYRGK